MDFFPAFLCLTRLSLMKNSWLTEECLIVIHTSTPSFVVCRRRQRLFGCLIAETLPRSACSDGALIILRNAPKTSFHWIYFLLLTLAAAVDSWKHFFFLRSRFLTHKEILFFLAPDWIISKKSKRSINLCLSECTKRKRAVYVWRVSHNVA